MKSFILPAALVVVLVLVAGPVMADECEPINARFQVGTYLDPCTYNGIDFDYCIDTPIWGTINGMWHFYGEEENWLGADPGPPYSSLWAGWALDVIETRRGTIYAQDNWLWNLSAFGLEGTKAGLPAVQLSIITGGTGQYEDASGWFGVILDDSGYWRGFMKGEICTPDDDE
jgi:hypothetical protein